MLECRSGGSNVLAKAGNHPWYDIFAPSPVALPFRWRLRQLRERGRIVECLFARWKGNGGIRRFRLRGLAGVQTECHGEWLALNLQVLIRLGGGGFGGSLALESGVGGVSGIFVRVWVRDLGCLVVWRRVLMYYWRSGRFLVARGA